MSLGRRIVGNICIRSIKSQKKKGINSMEILGDKVCPSPIQINIVEYF
jgi:hypothetical protein